MSDIERRIAELEKRIDGIEEAALALVEHTTSTTLRQLGEHERSTPTFRFTSEPGTPATATDPADDLLLLVEAEVARGLSYDEAVHAVLSERPDAKALYDRYRQAAFIQGQMGPGAGDE